MFRFHFSGSEELKRQVASLQQDVKHEQLKAELSLWEVHQFRQYVAGILPNQLDQINSDKWSLDKWGLRQIASIVRSPDHELDFVIGAWDKAKMEFREQNYEAAAETLKGFLNRSKLSPHMVEAKFLLSESYYLQKKFNEAVGVIEDMVAQHPDNELTGFALLRLGQIHQTKERKDEAYEVYSIVIKSFGNIELKKQAEILLAELTNTRRRPTQ